MAREPFQVEVKTPDGDVFSGQVEFVSTTTGVGSIGILRGHQPVLAQLVPAKLELHTSASEVVVFAQSEGYLQISGDAVRLLVQEALAPSSLDAATLREQLATAESEAAAAAEGSEARARAERDQRRYATYLEVAGEA